MTSPPSGCGGRIQVQPLLHGKSEGSLGNLRSCVKIKIKNYMNPNLKKFHRASVGLVEAAGITHMCYKRLACSTTRA